MLTHNISNGQWMLQDEKPCFTADPHFGHENIITKIKLRNFASVDAMDEHLIKCWNLKVVKNQHVFVLGDFSWYDPDKTAKILAQLNGVIHIVWGNHDKSARKISSLFATVHDKVELKVSGYPLIVLDHYPMISWNRSRYGTWHLHGHLHGDLPDDPNVLRIDIGVDCHNYQPLTIDEISSLMTKKTFKKEQDDE